MKPENLKSPFPWKERRVLLQDRVWYIPNRDDQSNSFAFPGWSHPSIFGQERPICLEYCSGNGAWIANRAQTQPDYHWVAIERKFERVKKIWSKIKNFQLSNLLVVCGEGHHVTHHYLPSSSVHAVFINFPDPWPKRRHSKHRIVQVPFIQEVCRILQTGGMLTLVTDDETCSQGMIEVLHQEPGFVSLFASPFYVTDYFAYGTSYFEDLWREKGKTIRYHVFRKVEL